MNCPVCHDPMSNTILNSYESYWICPHKEINFSVEISHANLKFDKDQLSYMFIISGEYAFHIWYNNIKQTKINVLKLIGKRYSWELLLEINYPLSLQWDDPKKVAERVKTLIIFS